MQKFNGGLAKSVSLDFSWNQFVKYLSYKCKRERAHLILVDRFFPSSKLCSHCGYKHEKLSLSERTWACPECNRIHERDINASLNIKKEGIRLLKEQGITIITHEDTSTVGTTGIHAFGDHVRPHSLGAVVEELGIHSL
jgi:putative transposase